MSHTYIRTLGGIQTSNFRNDIASIIHSPLAWKQKNIRRYMIVVSRGLDEQLWSSMKHSSIRLDGVEGS